MRHRRTNSESADFGRLENGLSFDETERPLRPRLCSRGLGAIGGVLGTVTMPINERERRTEQSHHSI